VKSSTVGNKLDDNARIQRGERLFDPEADAGEMSPGDSRPPGAAEPRDSWEPPVSFDAHQVPAFPLTCLPSPLREYVGALAEATQVPVDMPGSLALAAVAACIQRRVIVQVKAGYIEPTSLYVAVISYPGTRKSAVVSPITSPLQEWETQEEERLRPEIERARSDRAIKEKRKARAEEEAANGKSPEIRAERAREAATLAEDLAAEGPAPAYPRLLADDATPEALARLLAEQGERMSLFSAEGGIFEMMAGRYSQGVPNLDVYLKGHAGDLLRVDRRSGPPVLMNHPALTMGLAVQPDVLRGLADKPGFRGRGLIARFLYALPPNLMGRRRAGTPAVSDAIVQAYRRCLLGLLETEPNADGRPTCLSLSDAAAQTRLTFERRLEPRLGTGGDLGHMGDWAGKAVGAAVRIAGVLHAVQCVQSRKPTGGAIEGQTMQAAVALVEGYYLPHAEAALAEMGVDPEIDKARRVLARLLSAGMSEFTVRELHQVVKGQGCFRTAEAVVRSVTLLESHNYLRRLAAPAHGPGRPASPRYAVNPLAMKQAQNSQNSQNRVGVAPSEDSEDFEEASPTDKGRP
jgi:replicative DNA helicase